MNTLKTSTAEYQPTIFLNKWLSRKTLSYIRHVSFAGAVITLTGYFVDDYFYSGDLASYLLGGCFIFIGIWIEQILIFSYHNHYYFHGLGRVVNAEKGTEEGTTYELAESVSKDPTDVTFSFCAHRLGHLSLLRAGISEEAIQAFLSSPRQKISTSSIIVPDNEIFSLIGLGKYLLMHDVGFNELIRSAGTSDEDFINTLRWVIGNYHTQKRLERWWSIDNLTKRSGLGEDLSQGRAYLLERFSKNIQTSAVFSTLYSDKTYADEKVAEIETILTRSQSANVLLIGEAGIGKIDIVVALKRKISSGQSLVSIHGKRFFVIDNSRLLASCPDRQSLEITLINLLDEATSAGDIIIVFENISQLIREASSIGVALTEILDQYLALPQLQIIATDTPEAFHKDLEPIGSFTRRFSEVLIDSPDLNASTRLLQNIALSQESSDGPLFTYPGIKTIAQSAERYIVQGAMPDKAITLLIDIASQAKNDQQKTITAEYVYHVVSEITHIPAGPINDSDKDILIHLEDKLHQEVIGQTEPIKAVARAMRRSAAGINASNRPIGSFLFLGPTGVGKTKTAKTLAKVFFGDEEKIQRLDMSEYSGVDSLPKLIGDAHQTGALPNILREHPYCVLLVDEFEKSSQAVRDIFLQVLDEGIFKDGQGQKVNARNTIIIATSNAGSQLILKTIQQRKEFDVLTQEIINHIIEKGLFRPELINRFDSAVIFEPLSPETQLEVTTLMVRDLYKRIKEQGYELYLTRDLIGYLSEASYNPEFGARPIRRIIQDVIEEKIAQEIIGGNLVKGNTIKLGLEDFSSEELKL